MKLALCFIISVLSFVAQAETVRFALFNVEYPPLQQLVRGKLTGADIDILQEAFRRAPSFELQLQPMFIDIAYQRFVAGEVDAVFSYINPKYTDGALLPSKPIRNAEYRLMVLKGKKVPYQSLSDLKGMSIATVSGTPLGPLMEQASRENIVNMQRYPAHEQAIKMLRRGWIDGVFMYNHVAQYYANKMAVAVDIVEPGPVDKREFYVAIAQNSGLKNPAALQRELSQALESMWRDGSQQAIMARYTQRKTSLRKAR